MMNACPYIPLQVRKLLILPGFEASDKSSFEHKFTLVSAKGMSREPALGRHGYAQ